MSNNETLKRDIRRQKRKTLPPEPQDLASINLQLPHTFSLEAIPTVFLQYDSGPQAGDRRVLKLFAPSCHISGTAHGWELFYGTKHFCATLRHSCTT